MYLEQLYLINFLTLLNLLKKGSINIYFPCIKINSKILDAITGNIKNVSSVVFQDDAFYEDFDQYLVKWKKVNPNLKVYIISPVLIGEKQFTGNRISDDELVDTSSKTWKKDYITLETQRDDNLYAFMKDPDWDPCF